VGDYSVTAALLIHSKKCFNVRLVLPSFELFEVAIPTIPMFTHLTFCGVVTTVTAFDVDCLAFRKINYPQFCDVIVVVQKVYSQLHFPALLNSLIVRRFSVLAVSLPATAINKYKAVVDPSLPLLPSSHSLVRSTFAAHVKA
jgi:hypothetical protein